MPTYDLDDDGKGIFDEIVIKVAGKTFIIADVGKKEFDRISEIGDPYEQFAAWARVPVKEVQDIPMRKIGVALKCIAKELFAPAMGDLPAKKV